MAADIIVIAIVAVIFIYCLKKYVHSVKSGECDGCGGNCSQCHSQCRK